MSELIPLYDAKAHFSALVKQVRETGVSVVVSVHGQPAVEIRPYAAPAPQSIEERLKEMEARGELIPAKRKFNPSAWTAGVRRPGALKRFLEERRSDE
ncbi:MAG: type II toxin-antitoxin system prevent-host-death family antitoxin [Gemmatimonadetes bacterium]|nr:type II toxin-antitoxin system prevent-host-death family antitoxin [Gemmatimonadota bacterium]